MRTENGECNEDILEEIVRYMDNSDRQLIYKLGMHLELLNRWLFIKNLGLNLEPYFIEKRYQQVAIYGMADLGCRLLEELECIGVRVSYGIDRAPLTVNVRNRIRIIEPEQYWEKNIDAVIVTPIFYFKEKKKMIQGKVECPIISLKEIVWRI